MKIIILHARMFKGLASQVLENLNKPGVEVELTDESTVFPGNYRSPLDILQERVKKADLVIFIATAESMSYSTFEYITDLAEQQLKLTVYTPTMSSFPFPEWFQTRHRRFVTNFEILYESLQKIK